MGRKFSALYQNYNNSSAISALKKNNFENYVFENFKVTFISRGFDFFYFLKTTNRLGTRYART